MAELVISNPRSQPAGTKLEFSAAAKLRFDMILGRYPTKQAALLPVLWLAQEEFGWISKETVEYVGGLLELSPAYVDGVVTFYTMYHRQPAGKIHVQVCTSIACHLCGGRELLEKVEQATGVKAGSTGPDGLFSVEEVECIAACDGGPALIWGEDYELRVDDARLEALIRSAKKGA